MIVHPDFLDHYKTQMLVDMTGDPASPLFVLRLWAHCQQRRLARFSGLAPSALKAICRATALEANKLRSILLQCGFIRVEGDLTIVHDWEETNAALFGSWDNGRRGGRPPKKKPNENPRVIAGLPTANPDETDKRREEQKPEQEKEPPPRWSDAPSIEQAVGVGARIGLSKEESEKFWHHFEAVGWLNKHNQPIRNWQSKLASWKAENDSNKNKPNGTHSRTPIGGHARSGTDRNANTANAGNTSDYRGVGKVGGSEAIPDLE